MTAVSRDVQSELLATPRRPPIQWGLIPLWGFMGLLVLVILFPLWWVLRTALTTPGMILDNIGALLPPGFTMLNFERVLGFVDPRTLVGAQASNISVGQINFWLYLRNTIIVATLGTAGQLFFSSMAAYAFARLRFPFRNQIFFCFLIGLMVPSLVLFIPNYILIRQLGLINTFAGIVAPTFLMTPFAVFFIRQFFLSLNKDLEEAARLDGASIFGIFWRIALPLTSGPLITLGLLTFINTWNDYLWPLIVGKDDNVRVLTVALGVFQQQTPQGSPDWSGLMAGALVSVLPILILFVIFGRRIMDSIQFSGFR